MIILFPWLSIFSFFSFLRLLSKWSENGFLLLSQIYYTPNMSTLDFTPCFSFLAPHSIPLPPHWIQHTFWMRQQPSTNSHFQLLHTLWLLALKSLSFFGLLPVNDYWWQQEKQWGTVKSLKNVYSWRREYNTSSHTTFYSQQHSRLLDGCSEIFTNESNASL